MLFSGSDITNVKKLRNVTLNIKKTVFHICRYNLNTYYRSLMLHFTMFENSFLFFVLLLSYRVMQPASRGRCPGIGVDPLSYL